MNLYEFLNRIFLYYPPEINEALTLETIYSDYTKCLDNGTNYNYDEAFLQLLRNYKYRKTPPVIDLISVLNANKIANLEQPKKDDGCVWDGTIVGTAKNGVDYEFAIEKGLSFEDARQNLVKRGLTNIRKRLA